MKSLIYLALRSLGFGVIFGSVLFYFYVRGSSQAPPLRITVAEQSGSPLLILLTFVDSSNPLQPRYGYSLTNTTNKPIAAYTILERVGSSIISSTFTHYPAKRLFLESYGSKQEVGGEGRGYREAPVSIRLAVDFVEFADGTRWGEDTIKSGELLDGKRAGGRAAIKRYREILAREGPAALEEALTNPNLISPETSRSDHWVNGFKMGVNVVKSRLKTQKTKGGNGVRLELEKPFDSTEGRQEP